MKLRTISGCPALLSSLGNRRWRRIHFFFFLFCCFSVFYSIWRAFCSRRQIDAKITEQVLHHLEYFISPLVDLCSNSSRTRLPSHHLTANATIEWWCYTTATGFAAGASLVRLRAPIFSPFTSSSFVRFVSLFDLPLAYMFFPLLLLRFKTNAHIRPDHHQHQTTASANNG